MPNTELGHVQIRGKPAEHRASDAVRKRKELTWEEWSARLTEYINYLEFLFSPDLFIIGGGISTKHDKFFKLLNVNTEIIPANLFNDAGIVGAALAARELI
jgi:polyphosphate glucokinase